MSRKYESERSRPTRHTRGIIFTLTLIVMGMGLGACERHPIASRTERQRGYEALYVQDQDKAFIHFQEAIERDPTDWKSHVELGKLYLDRGEPIRAQLHLDQALRLRMDQPERKEITDLLAESLYQQGRYESLYALLRETSEAFGTTEDYLREGDFALKTGDADAALVAYRKAARFAREDDARPYDRMADLYEAAGDARNTVLMLRYVFYFRPADPDLAQRLRAHGVIPGPTVGIKPPREDQPDQPGA